MPPIPTDLRRSWRAALPDLVAFLLGLGVAWALRWRTEDLIWSLWLSSLVVGYSLILWSLAEPALELLGLGWLHRDEVRASPAWNDRRQLAVVLALGLVGAAFYLAFFTVHFGGFHFIHAQFLLSWYPLGDGFHTMNRATLAEVFRRYWGALPSAFLARRYAFARRTFVAAPSTAGPARRLLGARDPSQSRVFGPYLQVMRMHVVIIAFGAVHAARRESFAVYAAVYVFYFLPWRLLRQRTVSESDLGTAIATAVSP
jgi:hypothetical protein